MTVVNVYAPTTASEKYTFFEELVDVIRTIQVEGLLICGSFSCVLDNELDVISDGKHAVSTVKKFTEKLSDFDLYDTWRLFHGDSKDFAWSKRSPFVARRRDFILSTSGVSDKIIDRHIISVPTSDHRGRFIHVKLNEIAKEVSSPFRGTNAKL